MGIAFCQRDDKNSSVGGYGDDHDHETDAVVTTHRSDERIWIYRVTENGLLDKTGLLHAGMKVIAINNRACPKTLEEITQIVQSTVGYLSILAVEDELDSPISIVPTMIENRK